MKLVACGLLIASLAGVVWIFGSIFFNMTSSRGDDQIALAAVGLLSTVVFVTALAGLGLSAPDD